MVYYLVAVERSKTGKHWSQYFIFATQTGNWELHLQCIEPMLPVFHTAERMAIFQEQ